MCKQILSSMLVLFLFVSCAKNSVESQLDEPNLQARVDELNDELYPGDDGEGAKYVEKACVTGNKAGTLCESGKGKCKKERSCEAVSLAYARMNDRDIEIAAEAHAAKMVREGYIDQKDIESSRRVARGVYRLQRN